MSAEDVPSQEELEGQFARLTRARMEKAKAALREARVAPTGRPVWLQVAPGHWMASVEPGLVLMEALAPQERAQAARMLAPLPEPEQKEEAQHDP